MVRASLRMTVKQFYPAKPRHKSHNIEELKDELTRNKFEGNLLCNFEENDSVENLWNKLVNTYKKAANDVLNVKKSRNRD